MSLRSFLNWIDDDFNHTKPYSFVLIMGLLALPLAIAFLLDAPVTIVEIMRWVALLVVMSVLESVFFEMSLEIQNCSL